eukprot:m.203920 g.203920  ORF g.203920 m.203920 type:complete len:139 (+) comp17078_c0_seq1:82-498(+)
MSYEIAKSLAPVQVIETFVESRLTTTPKMVDPAEFADYVSALGSTNEEHLDSMIEQLRNTTSHSPEAQYDLHEVKWVRADVRLLSRLSFSYYLYYIPCRYPLTGLCRPTSPHQIQASTDTSFLTWLSETVRHESQYEE